jgi:hypothetical protein
MLNFVTQMGLSLIWTMDHSEIAGIHLLNKFYDKKIYKIKS